LSGKLHKAKAILVGECYKCEPGGSGRTRLSLNKSVEEVLRERLSGLGIPVVYGLRLGHGQDQFTLPIGVTASLEATRGKVKFKIEESGTI
jgi:muramoyltetrapeptide carboxypeptidase